MFFWLIPPIFFSLVGSEHERVLSRLDKILVDVYAHSGVNGLITLYAMFFHVLYNNLTFKVFVKNQFSNLGLTRQPRFQIRYLGRILNTKIY